MLNHLPLIFKNTWRNKRRTLLTLGSIAASLCLLGFLLAIYNMFYLEPSSADQAFRLITRNRVSLANPLPVSYQARIAQVKGVQEVMIFQWFGGTYKDAREAKNFFARFALEIPKMRTVYPEYKIPDDQFQALVSERTSCVVGNKLAKTHGFTIGSKILLKGDIFPVDLDLTVRAIYESEKDNEAMYFHYSYLNESLSKRRMDSVGTFIIRMADPNESSRISQDVDAMFRNAPLQTKTETERAFELSFLGFLGNVKAFLLAIFSAISFTVLLVSGNTMAMAVRERVKEVGILKTLGFTNGKIFSLLLGESVVISVLGGIVGLTLTILLIEGLRSMPSSGFDVTRLRAAPWVLVATMLIAIAIGLISSAVPAWMASRRSIIDAMRVTE